MLTVKTKKASDDNDDQEKEGNDDNDDEVAVEEEAACLEACHKTNYRGPALYTHHTMHCNAMYYVKRYHKLHCYVCQNIYSKQSYNALYTHIGTIFYTYYYVAMHCNYQ